jgi:hypothetical protein
MVWSSTRSRFYEMRWILKLSSKHCLMNQIEDFKIWLRQAEMKLQQTTILLVSLLKAVLSHLIRENSQDFIYKWF